MKTDNNLRKIRGAAFAALTLGVLSLLGGCAADENRSGTGKGAATLSFNVAGINDAVEDPGTRSLPAPETVSQVQADGTVLDFTLTPVAPSSTRATTTMTAGNKYKYMLLDPSGNIVTSALDGVAGTATSKVIIDIANAYTVVAYSYNDASSTLPSPGSGGAAPSTALGMDANKDFLYFKETIPANTYTANTSNTRAVTFDHKYSQVTVVVDATSLAANVTSVGTVTLGPSYASTLNVATGAVAKTGSSTPATVTFNSGNLGTSIARSDPAVLFTNGETPLTLSVGSLTIGGTTYTGKSVTFSRALQSGVSYTLTVNAHTAIPASITLAQNQKYFMGSVYDVDYMPYTAPTALATPGASPANGIVDANEPPIDIQGSVTPSGITVNIPLVAGSTGTLPAYSTTITVPASLTEDGISRDLTFSWAAVANVSGLTSIPATIKAVGGTLNAKKLDINAGIGNDFLGVLLGTFAYPYNHVGNTTTYQLRDIGAIPDRMYGQADNSGSTTSHQFLYLPITGEDGRVWLNNNLGADYTNANNSSFNLVQQATALSDYHAFGSMIQWGRATDGHELINWTSGAYGNSGATPVNAGSLAGPVSTDTPTTAKFIIFGGYGNVDWRGPQNNNLWQGVSGINNPCPIGFRVPTDAEYATWVSVAGITNMTTAASSKLKLSISGQRSYDGSIWCWGNAGNYWNSTVSGTFADIRTFGASVTISSTWNRCYGFPVRCIKD